MASLGTSTNRLESIICAENGRIGSRHTCFSSTPAMLAPITLCFSRISTLNDTPLLKRGCGVHMGYRGPMTAPAIVVRCKAVDGCIILLDFWFSLGLGMGSEFRRLPVGQSA